MKDDTEKPPRKPRTRARKEGGEPAPATRAPRRRRAAAVPPVDEKPPRKPRTRARKEAGEPAPATPTPRRRRAAAAPPVDAPSAAVTGATDEASADTSIVALQPEGTEGSVAAEVARAAGDADATVPEPAAAGDEAPGEEPDGALGQAPGEEPGDEPGTNIIPLRPAAEAAGVTRDDGTTAHTAPGGSQEPRGEDTGTPVIPLRPIAGQRATDTAAPAGARTAGGGDQRAGRGFKHRALRAARLKFENDPVRSPLSEPQLDTLLDLLHERGRGGTLVSSTWTYLERGMSYAHASVTIDKLRGTFRGDRRRAA